MSDLRIPDKCEECGRRKPTIVTSERGMDRNFNAHLYLRFICDKCKVKDGDTKK